MGRGRGADLPGGAVPQAGGRGGRGLRVVAGDGLEDWEVVATGAVSEESLGGGIEQALLRDSETDAGRDATCGSG